MLSSDALHYSRIVDLSRSSDTQEYPFARRPGGKFRGERDGQLEASRWRWAEQTNKRKRQAAEKPPNGNGSNKQKSKATDEQVSFSSASPRTSRSKAETNGASPLSASPNRSSSQGDGDDSSSLRRSTRARKRPSQFGLSRHDLDALDGDKADASTSSPSRARAARTWISDDDDGDQRERQRQAQRLGVRIHNPKTFGPIPDIPVGSWWPSRMECSTAAVHAPTVAGISGNAQVGCCWSVALSGGAHHNDDVDLGLGFTYTGSGGRDLKGTASAPKNLRTAPQTRDQSFDDARNAALKKSAQTGKPVRVVRGVQG